MDLVEITDLQRTEEEMIDPGVILDRGVTVDPGVVADRGVVVDRVVPIVVIPATMEVKVDDDTVDLQVMTVTLFPVEVKVQTIMMKVPNLMIRRILENMIVVVRVIIVLVEVVVEVIIKRDQGVTKMIEMLKDDQTMEKLRWK